MKTQGDTTVTAAPAPAPPSPERPPIFSVIVPVSERPQPLDELYEEFAIALEEAGCPAEFLFVSEPWGREATAVLEGRARPGMPIRVLYVGQNVGESSLLLAAAAASHGRYFITLPPYRRVKPSEIGKLVEQLRAGADLATAVRRREGDRWVNRLQARVFHTLLGWFVGGRFRDIASGVRAMRRRVLDEVPLYGDSFRFLPLLASREGFRVVEVEVEQDERDHRTKIYSPGIYVRRFLDLIGIAFLTRFTRKPLRFFGLVGSVFAGVGGIILSVMVIQRFGGTPIANRPLLVLGMLLVVLGIQAFALGLIGEIIVHLNAASGAYRTLDGDRITE